MTNRKLLTKILINLFPDVDKRLLVLARQRLLTVTEEEFNDIRKEERNKCYAIASICKNNYIRKALPIWGEMQEFSEPLRSYLDVEEKLKKYYENL